jgi:hypothetical protein
VPLWDGIEPLKAAMDNGSIPPEQSAVLIYGAASTAEATEASINYGMEAQVGWFLYIIDSRDYWASISSPLVMAAQAAAVI